MQPPPPRNPLLARATATHAGTGEAVPVRGWGRVRGGRLAFRARPPRAWRPMAAHVPIFHSQLAQAPLAPAKGRGKVPLEKGYSQIDWLRRARERPGVS